MIKVLVVEDEWILRKGLISSIDWGALGCTVIGEAENGREGLEFIRKKEPDIVITDIRMPVMDGLQMLESAMYEKMKFYSIILTGYAEFEYARKALTLRAVDYILKPVDESAFYNMLLTITEEIKERRKKDLSEQINQSDRWPLLTELFSIGNEDDSAFSSYSVLAIQEIRKRYKERLSIEDVAEKLFVSSSYLSRRFKAETGYTFGDYLNRYRISKAVQLLIRQNYRVNEVADLTGFNGYKHFYEVFHRYTGMTPTEFMKERGKIIAHSPGFL